MRRRFPEDPQRDYAIFSDDDARQDQIAKSVAAWEVKYGAVNTKSSDGR